MIKFNHLYKNYRRTDGWNWFGKECWWEVDIIIHGYHGGGGYVITEQWRWNDSTQYLRYQTLNLSFKDSQKLFERFGEEHVQAEEKVPYC